MRFAIVITAYNKIEYLKEAIESVHQQTYKEPFQLILVDDCSTDDTKFFKMLLPNRDIDFMAIRNARNLGIQKSYNIACYHVNDDVEWIVRLDHDDRLLPNALSDLDDFINNLEDSKVGFIYSDLKIMETGKERIYPDWDGTILGLQSIGHLQAIRKDVSDKFGHWDITLKYSADTDAIIKVIESSYRIKHIPKVLMENRLHEEQYTQQFFKIEDPNKYKEIIFNRAIQKRPDLWPEGWSHHVMQTTGSPLWRSEAIYVEKFCKGNGLDLGCSSRKKYPWAIGVDITRQGGKVPELVWDGREELPFKDGTLDYILGCHVIEHITDPVDAIRGWAKKIKQGGLIILIIPDKRFIPNIGTPQGDPTHLHDWTPKDFHDKVVFGLSVYSDMRLEEVEFGELGNNWSFACVLRRR